MLTIASSITQGSIQSFLLFSTRVQFNAVSRPSGDATAKEILVLCPDWKIKQQCYGYYRPIVRVARRYALPRHDFVVFVQVLVHGLNDVANRTFSVGPL
jgi:hypothetical protein